jgi:hypothetical protein
MPDRKLPFIEVGYQVFLGDGSGAFGAVRDVGRGGRPELLVNVENAGDFVVPLDCIDKVVSKRVVVRFHDLPHPLQEAVRHTLEREDFPPPGGEVDLVDSAGEPLVVDEEQDDSYAPGYEVHRNNSPPGEFPGRDLGSAYGAPTSISSPRRR